MQRPKAYWFPLKRHGWGWGPPTTWQGWVAIAVYVVAAVIGIPTIHARQGNAMFIGYLGLLTLAFAAVCWIKGEKR
jgi:hypothetical protein